MSTEMYVILDILFMTMALYFAMEVKSKGWKAFWSFMTIGYAFFLILDLIKVSQELAT